MDSPELMRAIAQRVAQVPGVAGAYYPALDVVPVSPCVFILDGSTSGPSIARHDTSGQTLELPRITIRILVKSLKQRPREASKIDTLIDPIKDALNPAAFGGSVNRLFIGLSSHVDRLWTEVSIIRGNTIEYSGEFCYAADLTIDPKFHRTPDLALPPTVLS